MDVTLERVVLPFTPLEVFVRLAGRRGLAFLDSGVPAGSRVDSQSTGARFSWIAIEPVETIEDDFPPTELGRPRPARDDREPPFRTGWIGFAAYEAAGLLAGSTHPRGGESAVDLEGAGSLPLAWWGRYPATLAFDAESGSWFLAKEDGARGRDAAARLLDAITEHPPRSLAFHAGAPEAVWTPEEHGARVLAILDWIARGHIYQANLTYPIRGEFSGDPEALFLEMRRRNPAPHGAFLRVREELAILSSSPERFLRVEGGEISTEPIKGTRPRDLGHPGRDTALAEQLVTSAKDRAELTMIVDLERNDLGRLCRYGSVRTEAFPRLVTFPTVHHLVATVRGELAEPCTFREILAATFPGGSVTGAPKIRAMEILAELEGRPRFVYCGALGYLDPGGSMDLALPIRTLYTHGARYEVGVGGGIVADSDPGSEWLETRHKADAILRALSAGASSATRSAPAASCP